MATTRKTAKKSKPRKSAPVSKTKRRVSSSKLRKAPAKAKRAASEGRGRARSSAAGESPKAMRLTFSYDGDDVKLVSKQTVDMVVPPSDPVKGFARQKGFWAELKGAKDKTLYRQVMHNPTRNDAEVFSDDPEQSISRAPAPTRKGVFVVVVPETDKGEAVALVRSSPTKKGADRGLRSLATERATEFARFKIK
jgi:hypothetical protein